MHLEQGGEGDEAAGLRAAEALGAQRQEHDRGRARVHQEVRDHAQLQPARARDHLRAPAAPTLTLIFYVLVLGPFLGYSRDFLCRCGRLLGGLPLPLTASACLTHKRHRPHSVPLYGLPLVSLTDQRDLLASIVPPLHGLLKPLCYLGRRVRLSICLPCTHDHKKAGGA